MRAGITVQKKVAAAEATNFCPRQAKGRLVTNLCIHVEFDQFARQGADNGRAPTPVHRPCLQPRKFRMHAARPADGTLRSAQLGVSTLRMPCVAHSNADSSSRVSGSLL